MSLEQALTENTAAIRELIAKLGAMPLTATMVATDPTPAPEVVKLAAGKRSAAKGADSPRTAEVGPSTSDLSPGASETSANDSAKPTATPADAPSASPTYDEVKGAILEVSKSKGRQAAIDLLTKFGAKTGPDVKPDQYADFIAAATSALGKVPA